VNVLLLFVGFGLGWVCCCLLFYFVKGADVWVGGVFECCVLILEV